MADPVGCWREYFRRCIEQETFIIPTKVGNKDDVITRLRQILFEKGGMIPCAV